MHPRLREQAWEVERRFLCGLFEQKTLKQTTCGANIRFWCTLAGKIRMAKWKKEKEVFFGYFQQSFWMLWREIIRQNITCGANIRFWCTSAGKIRMAKMESRWR